MRRLNIPKILMYFSCIMALFGFGLAVGTYRIFPYSVFKFVQNSIQEVVSELPTLTKSSPDHYLQPAVRAGDGVIVNDPAADQSDLIFLSGFFDGNPGLRLMWRNGEIVAKWPTVFSEIFANADHVRKPPETDWNIDIHGSVMLPDGSVVFNFEYGGLVKLNRCGAVEWALPRITHHSVVRAEGGGFWVPGRRLYGPGEPSPFPPFMTPFREDTLLKISEDGAVLMEISVPEIFYKNGLEATLTVREFDSEIVHLNKIAELSSAKAGRFPMFNAGALALSFRKMNMLMVIDPESLEVLWQQTGPWLRQHDPIFAPDGRLTLFNNNLYAIDMNYPDPTTIPRISNIMAVDPETGEVEVIYGAKIGQDLLSRIRGKVRPTVSGGLLITEFEGGRVFEVDAQSNVIWEYIDRYGEDEVAEISGARIYPAGYLANMNWSCGLQ